MIKLHIERFTKNENYETEMNEYREKNRYNNSFNENAPTPKTINDILNIEITEEQFVAIRKAVLENF